MWHSNYNHDHDLLMSWNSSTDSWVRSFEHLQNFPRADEALNLLKRLASLVKPIMRKHGWMLPTLAEFFPDQTNLLGAR